MEEAGIRKEVKRRLERNVGRQDNINGEVHGGDRNKE